MKQCNKGHKYPDSLDRCPVCEKENELQTIVIKAAVPPFEPKPKPAPSFTEQQQPGSPVQPQNSKSDNCQKTVILNRSPLPEKEKNILVGCLIELDTEDRHIRIHQLFNHKMIIGRSKDNNIVLSDSSVSGKHCWIEYQNDKLIICDNNSTNKTIVNSKPVKSHILKDNDFILLGNSKFKIKYL